MEFRRYWAELGNRGCAGEPGAPGGSEAGGRRPRVSSADAVSRNCPWISAQLERSVFSEKEVRGDFIFRKSHRKNGCL